MSWRKVRNSMKANSSNVSSPPRSNAANGLPPSATMLPKISLRCTLPSAMESCQSKVIVASMPPPTPARAMPRFSSAVPMSENIILISGTSTLFSRSPRKKPSNTSSGSRKPPSA